LRRLALAAGRARHWLVHRPAAGAIVSRTVGAFLVGAAVFTGIEGWRMA
jgi:threonine/homoserine/homoserine lactone efflux protein